MKLTPYLKENVLKKSDLNKEEQKIYNKLMRKYMTNTHEIIELIKEILEAPDKAANLYVKNYGYRLFSSSLLKKLIKNQEFRELFSGDKLTVATKRHLLKELNGTDYDIIIEGIIFPDIDFNEKGVTKATEAYFYMTFPEYFLYRTIDKLKNSSEDGTHVLKYFIKSNVFWKRTVVYFLQAPNYKIPMEDKIFFVKQLIDRDAREIARTLNNLGSVSQLILKELSSTYIIKMLKAYGALIASIPEEDRTMAFKTAAIKQSGTNLRLLKAEEKTPELCKLAINQSPSTLQYVPSEFLDRGQLIQLKFQGKNVNRHLKRLKIRDNF